MKVPHQFSNGPLVISRSPVGDGFKIHDGHGNAAVGRTYNDPSGDVARVFSAAPDLLAAAKNLLSHHRVCRPRIDSDTLEDCRNELRAAIARAEKGGEV